MKYFQEGGTTDTGYNDPLAGNVLGQESSLSSWAGPYVTDMLGRARSLASMPYTAYTGPLTAGTSELQEQAFQGLGSLQMPSTENVTFDPQSFTGEGIASQFMSPYIEQAIEPQLAEARRQAEISRVNQAGRMTRAGSFGGGRQAIMESELNRNLLRNLADITGEGYQRAFESGRSQFNTEEDRRLRGTGENRRFALEGLGAMLGAGDVQRDITSEGITADLGQFREERDYPFKMAQYMQSMLQGLPLGTQQYSYQQPTGLANFMGGTGGIMSLLDILNSGGEA